LSKIKIVKKAVKPRIIKAINNIVGKDLEFPKYECADNYRWAEIGNKKQLKLFMIKKEAGCCGCYEDTITVLGKQYLIGFNYGH